MSKDYPVSGQEGANRPAPAMTPEQKRRWRRYKKALDDLPDGIPGVCSALVEAMAANDKKGGSNDGD